MRCGRHTASLGGLTYVSRPAIPSRQGQPLRSSHLGHNDRLQRFIEDLDLTDINLFAQDWGSLIGLRVAGLNADRFATITIGDGMLPAIPAGTQLQPPVESPDEVADIESVFAAMPAQQPALYDGCEFLRQRRSS